MADATDSEFTVTDEQQALRGVVDDYTARRWDDERLRAVVDSGERDPRDLRILGSELGVEISPAEFERDAWATPRKLVEDIQNRLAAAA